MTTTAPSRRYARSESALDEARLRIPLGSQTFSKSYTQFPRGAAPFFIERGQGSRVWDVDGNEYIDFVNGLLAVSLGYRDPDVDAAVIEQLGHGVTFSLAHPLEMRVAEKICEMVPCAEMVRFGKNGSDATTGAVRLARAVTGRDHVAVCGYHGWHDWYISTTTRDLGVPGLNGELTHSFRYNDIASLEALFDQWPNAFSAVVMEPMNAEYPRDDFLARVRDLAHAHGALLVFDEIITGFRFAKGGAQELFGVTPDLVTLGKGLANGFPLSVLAGRGEYMRRLEDVFYSFTMGGETLSLAAALAVLEKIQREPVLETVHARGDVLMSGVRELIDLHGIGAYVSLSGHPSWSFLTFSDYRRSSAWGIKTLWLQEILARGILSHGTHNMSFAHTADDVSNLLKVYDTVFAILKSAADQGPVDSHLRGCEPLQPVFSVR